MQLHKTSKIQDNGDDGADGDHVAYDDDNSAITTTTTTKRYMYKDIERNAANYFIHTRPIKNCSIFWNVSNCCEMCAVRRCFVRLKMKNPY